MSQKVYTFRVSYEGFEDLIWRKIEVADNCRLDQLGYIIMAIFDTLAYHLFEFIYKDKHFAIPEESGAIWVGDFNMHDFSLKKLELEIHDYIIMNYDFGTTQTFLLELTEIKDLESQKQNKIDKYPYIIDGNSSGVIDDMSDYELGELIEQINKNGKTDEPIYYPYDDTVWDYRVFNRDELNSRLHNYIKEIENNYSQLFKKKTKKTKNNS